MNPKRILIARTDRLGDVVLSTPVIRFLRGKYPDAYLAFLVRPNCAGVIKNDPNLNEVVIYSKHRYEKNIWSMLKFVVDLRQKSFDMVIALHPSATLYLLLFLAGIPVRIGYDKKYPFLLTKAISHEKHKGLMHEVDYNFDLLTKAGFDTKDADRRPYFALQENEKLIIDRVLKTRGIDRDMIAVHPGASCPSKRWPPEKFAEVCDDLVKISNCDVVLVGGTETLEYSEVISMKVKGRLFNLTGILSVEELAELLSRCKVFISNDSGPVHISAAVGTPVVCIFGRKDVGLSPKRWGPLGEGHVIIHKDVGCESCLAHECEKSFKCLQAVTVDEVVNAALGIARGT